MQDAVMLDCLLEYDTNDHYDDLNGHYHILFLKPQLESLP